MKNITGGFKLIIQILALVIMFLGLLVMFGWCIQSSRIVHILPSYSPMQFNTALCFFLSGIAITLRLGGQRWFLIPCYLSCIINVLTLSEYLFGTNFGIDTIVLQLYFNKVVFLPGRMSPTTAICFIVLNLALISNIVRSYRTIMLFIQLLLIAIAFVLSLLAMFGYVFHVPSFYSWISSIGIAVHTAIGILLLAITQFLFIYREIIRFKAIKIYASALSFFAVSVAFVIFQWQLLILSAHKFYADSLLRNNQILVTNLANELKADVLALERFYRRLATDNFNNTLWETDSQSYLNNFNELVLLKVIDNKGISHIKTSAITFNSGQLTQVESSCRSITDLAANSRLDTILFGDTYYWCLSYKGKIQQLALLKIDRILQRVIDNDSGLGLLNFKIFIDNQVLFKQIKTTDPVNNFLNHLTTTAYPLNGAIMRIDSWPSQQYVNEHPMSFQPLLFLVFGLLVSILFSLLIVLVHTINQSNRNLKRLVYRRTKLLNKSRHQYMSLYENAPDLYLTFDYASRLILNCNDTLVNVLGYPNKTYLINQSIFILCAEECHAASTAMFEQMLTGDIYDQKLILLLHNGYKLHVSAKIGVHRDGTSGNPLVCYASFRDISHQVMLERELEKQNASAVMFTQNEQLYQTILNAVNDGWWDWNVETGAVYYSENVRILFGYEEHEFKDDNLGLWHAVIFAEDAEMVSKTSHLAVADKTPYRLTARFHHKNGQMLWLIVRGCGIIDQDGVVRRVVGTFTNVTEQHRLMDEIIQISGLQNAILNSAKQSIISTDCNGIIKSFNTGAEEMLGYSASEVINLQTPAIIHDSAEVAVMADKLSAEFNVEITPGFEVFVYRARLGGADTNQWTYIRKDGSRLQVELSVTALFDKSGEIYGYLGIAKDITELVIANEKLQFSRELLEQTGQMGLIGGWEVNLLSGEVLWTKTMYELFEAPLDYLSSYDADVSRFYEEGYYRDKVNSSFMDSVASGLSFDIEVRAISYQGNYKWMRVKGFPIMDNGSCVRMYGVCHDISDRVNLVRELEAERGRLGYMIDGTGLGTWEWNIQTGVTTFNKKWAEIIGYTLEELAPTDINTWTKYMHPDDQIRSNQLLTEHFIGKSEFYACEIRMRHRDGHWVWVLDRGKVTTWTNDGKPELMYGTHQEISNYKILQNELQKTAEKFQNLFELSPVGIAMNDFATGAFLEANNSLLNSIGYTLEEIKGSDYWDITPSEYQEQEQTQLESLRTTRLYGPYRKEYIRKDGSRYPVLLNGILTTDHTGREVIWSVVVDISQQVEYEANLIAARKAAEEASIAKSNFVANMSHEIRTPMNAVIGLSQLLTDTSLNHVQQDYVNKIINSSQLLLGIINDILDYSKIEAGKLMLENVKFNLDEVLNQLITIFIANNRSPENLEFFIHVDNNVPQNLFGDKLRIAQVLTNLLSNAVKFTPEGKIELAISLSSINSQEKTVSLLVSMKDTGIGISQEQQQSLFKPFSQSDSSITRKYGGTGLGLVISNQILRVMGSELNLESSSGIGSTFSFKLNLPYEDVPEDGRLAEIRNKKVLIVDDEPITRSIIRNILEGFNQSVSEAESAEAALTMILSHEAGGFDFVIMDWKMSGMNGLTAIRKLKLMTKEGMLGHTAPTILLVSAYSKHEIALTAEDDVALLTKPVTRGMLINALQLSINNTPLETLAAKPQLVSLLGKNILLVEDNLINQEVASLMLNKVGATIMIANNGLEAVNIISGNDSAKIDLILMDLQMPVMSGYEAAAIIHQQLPDLPIIALTATVMSEDIKLMLDSGMCDHIAKPVEANKLYLTVAKWLKVKVDTEIVAENQIQQHADFTIIDLEYIQTIVNNDLDKAMRLFDRFSLQLDEAMHVLSTNLEKTLEDEVRNLLHSLKGAAGNLGLNPFFTLFSSLEEAVRSGSNFSQANYASLDTLIKQFNSELNSLHVKYDGLKIFSSGSDSILEILDKVIQIISANEIVDNDYLKQLALVAKGSSVEELIYQFINLIENFAFDAALSLGHEIKNSLVENQ